MQRVFWHTLQDVSFDETLNLSSDSVKKLLKMTPSFVRTRWLEYPEKFDYWSDESGRVVLLGESAHPWFVSGFVLVPS